MSLLNEALKRVQQAQQRNQSRDGHTPALALRPVEQTEHHRIRQMPILAVVFLISGCSIGALYWLVHRTQAPSQPVPQAAPEPVNPAPLSPAQADSAQPTVQLEPTSGSARATVAQGADPSLGAQARDTEPERPQLRLQGIAYSPSSPIAIINGKSVGVGDRVGQWQVLAITRRSVFVGTGNQTNELTWQ